VNFHASPPLPRWARSECLPCSSMTMGIIGSNLPEAASAERCKIRRSRDHQLHARPKSFSIPSNYQRRIALHGNAPRAACAFTSLAAPLTSDVAARGICFDALFLVGDPNDSGDGIDDHVAASVRNSTLPRPDRDVNSPPMSVAGHRAAGGGSWASCSIFQHESEPEAGAEPSRAAHAANGLGAGSDRWQLTSCRGGT